MFQDDQDKSVDAAADGPAAEDRVIDLEAYARDGAVPPKGARYKIRVDKQYYVTDRDRLTGREILDLAGKLPVASFRLDEKLRGGATRKVELDEVVDLTVPGIERFQTLPLDQTEGSPAGEPLRRDFALPQEDVEYLNALGLPWETITEESAQWLLVHGFSVPGGFTVDQSTVALRLPGDYLTAGVDMAYFHPSLVRANGTQIPATSGSVQIRGQSYQQWSRHRTAQNPWRPGVDNISTHMGLVEEWLAKAIKAA